MKCVLFPRKNNYSTIQKYYISKVWFLENKVEKNWRDVMLHHMLNNQKRNTTLPYGELITQILVHSDYDLQEEEKKLCTQRYENGF